MTPVAKISLLIAVAVAANTALFYKQGGWRGVVFGWMVLSVGLGLLLLALKWAEAI
jgi:hypothetical protein